MKRIEAKPTDGLSYSPSEARYWDRTGLDREVERIFDLCHGCRLCFNLCPSFPALFEAVDAHEGDVLALKGDEKQRVFDLCYGCKVCYVRCPYTPDDGHEWQLDFPRLVLRARAVKAKETGHIPLRERVLSDPDRVGRFAGLTPRLANWANNTAFHRAILQSMLGIHRDKKLPAFAIETFEDWLKEKPLPTPPREPSGKVALFFTCFVNYNNPEPAKAAVRVLEKNRVQLVCPKQNCCGMPALDSGDVAFATRQAASNIASFIPFVRDGYKIAAINPTCSLMMKEEYPRLLDTPEAKEVALATVDTHEILFDLKREGTLSREFVSTPESIAYHVPCHLKAQAIGLRSRDLLRLIPDTEITTVDACCAHDGTWAMKTEFFPVSMKWGERAFAEMREPGAKVMSTDCPLAAIQFEQATGTRPIHPLEVLDRAYRKDGFPRAVSADGLAQASAPVSQPAPPGDGT